MIEKTFQIVDPVIVTKGDYVIFTIKDGEKTFPAQISGTALAVLDKSQALTPLDAFHAHHDRIRDAAYKMRRANPSLDVILLSAGNF